MELVRRSTRGANNRRQPEIRFVLATLAMLATGLILTVGGSAHARGIPVQLPRAISKTPMLPHTYACSDPHDGPPLMADRRPAACR